MIFWNNLMGPAGCMVSFSLFSIIHLVLWSSSRWVHMWHTKTPWINYFNWMCTDSSVFCKVWKYKCVKNVFYFDWYYWCMELTNPRTQLLYFLLTQAYTFYTMHNVKILQGVDWPLKCVHCISWYLNLQG